jgi:brefeldin A-inhibited guanine nucleotide-exchange protein
MEFLFFLILSSLFCQLDIAMEAIHLIRQCAKFVHENTLDFCSSATAAALSPDGGTDEQAPSSFRGNNDVWVRGWFPVLFELSCIINRSKLDIRTRSLTILFDVVKQYGHSYESSWWKDLFSVLFR